MEGGLLTQPVLLRIKNMLEGYSVVTGNQLGLPLYPTRALNPHHNLKADVTEPGMELARIE